VDEIAVLLRAPRVPIFDLPLLHVGRARLRKIRRFADVELVVREPGARARRATVFIGRNGTCKTTLLRALALGLCDAGDAASLLAEPVGRLTGGADASQIELDLEAPDGNKLTVTKRLVDSADKDALEASGPEPASLPFVCAYGAGRWGTGEDLPERYSRRGAMLTLFRYREPLHGVELTLRRLQDLLADQFQPLMARFARVLGLSPADTIDVAPGGGVGLSGPTFGDAIPLTAWADGYRLTFTWLTDLYAWASKARCITRDGHIHGILLIDEPEQHLHPSLQAAILPRLKEALPHMQLFVTTHSPLVALAAEPGELVVLREDGRHVVADQPTLDFSGYSAEDMLVDRQIFDTIPYAPATAHKLARYRELLAVAPDALAPEQARERDALARELRAQQLPEIHEDAAARELRALIQKHGL
jgi:PAS domain-containing protein